MDDLMDIRFRKAVPLVNSYNCMLLSGVCDQLIDGEMDEIELSCLLNLRNLTFKWQLIKGEAYRFCYMLHMIAQTQDFSKERRDYWIGHILAVVGIKKSYYSSHYKDPVNTTNERNTRFVRDLDDIFSHWQKKKISL